MFRAKDKSQAGFTIIELMIATGVLSTILVLTTVVMVNIGSLYYKGINQSRVQDDVRSISDELVRNIQLNDQPPTDIVDGPHDTKMVCVGDVRYAYILGVQIGKDAPGTGTVYHQVLWRDNNPSPGSCPTQIDPSDPSSPDIDLTDANLASDDDGNQGKELVTSNSRLTEFSMSAGSPSSIAVGVAYGDNDLLCNRTAVSTSCTTSTEMAPGAPNTDSHWPNYTGDVLCKGLKGDQFCSTAHTRALAVSRVAGGSF